jgi:hypothetical protein
MGAEGPRFLASQIITVESYEPVAYRSDPTDSALTRPVWNSEPEYLRSVCFVTMSTIQQFLSAATQSVVSW